MLRRVTGPLYGSTRVEFVSAFGLAESVERLKAATRRSIWSSLGETAAVGTVSQSRVKLQRVIPMISNAFKPFFVGRFELRDGVTVLTGRFTLSLFVKGFMTVWFGLLLIIGIGIVLAGAKPQVTTPYFLRFQPLLMVGFGVLLVAFGKWLARHDVAWLSAVIGSALGNPAVHGPEKPLADAAAVPTQLKVAAFVVAASGLTQLVLAVVRRIAPQKSTGPWVLQWIPPSVGLNVVTGIVFLLLATAIWRRRPAGWWGGFVVLAGSLLGPLNAIHSNARAAPPLAFQVVFSAISVVIAAVWGLWWCKQRQYFLMTEE